MDTKYYKYLVVNHPNFETRVIPNIDCDSSSNKYKFIKNLIRSGDIVRIHKKLYLVSSKEYATDRFKNSFACDAVQVDSNLEVIDHDAESKYWTPDLSMLMGKYMLPCMMLWLIHP
jgi:hypothetical protein